MEKYELMHLKLQLLELLMLDIRYFGIDVNGNHLPQTVLANEVKELLQEYPIGGVILFKENLDNKEQTHTLTQSLQNMYPTQNQDIEANAQILPRLIATDEEGGVVSRIGLDTIGNMALGAINDTNITRSNGRLIGYELNKLGINFNFAPVVDINSNPHNPIIGVRSFGDTPELVTRHAKAFIDGLHDASIISCAKHFPGHGDTATDTHLDTTILNKAKSEIELCELYPYKKLIEDNSLDAVMTAHIVAPTLDGKTILINGNVVATPATLSHEILTNILRKNMNFNGLIVTDALDMKAISNNFDAVTATIESIKAGCDIILMPVRIWDVAGISKFKEYFIKVHNICESDLELQTRIKQSYQRILAVKNKLLKNSKSNKAFDSWFGKNDSNNSSVNFCDNLASMDEKALFCHSSIGNGLFSNQLNLAQKAITLYKNTNNHIPFKITYASNILIIAENNCLLETTYLEAKSIAAKLFKDNQNLNFEKLLLDYQNIDVQELTRDLHKYSHIIVLTYNLKGMDSICIGNDNGVGENDRMTIDSSYIKVYDCCKNKDRNFYRYEHLHMEYEGLLEKNIINKLFSLLNAIQAPYVMLSCRNPYDINFAKNATTNILLYGVTGFDQTNYKITPFTLNLKAALNKILAMHFADTYNKFTPVSI